MSPYAAPRICSRCGRVVPARTACPCRPAFAGAGRRRKGQGDTWRRRRDYFLRAHPICEHVDGDPIVIPVEKVEMLDVLRDVIDATREES